MIKSDLFIINKIDLAPYVGANLENMKRTSQKFRGDGRFVFTNLKTDEGLEEVVDWIKKDCLLEDLESENANS
jgi:urease accessory protein